MSSGSDFTASLGQATQLAEYILGTNTITTSNNNQKSSSTNEATTTVTGSDTTETGSFTQAGADPGVIATLKALASTALSNSTDTSKTTGLLSGILQSAGDAMTAVFGQQNQAGIYNSSAASAQTGNIMARAAADAAQAILGYQTTEQSVADTALQQLLGATATTSTKSTQVQSSTASTQVQGSSSADIVGSSSSKQKSGISLICTFMFRHGKLDRYRYRIVSQDLALKPSYEIRGYQATVSPLVRRLKKNPFTLVSRLTMAVFAARTEYICATYNATGCRKTWQGWAARTLVATICFPASFYFFWTTPVDELTKEVGV